MNRSHLAVAILASLCATATLAAERNQTRFILQHTDGSQLMTGDTLVADGEGKAALYRGNNLVAVLHDPEDIAGEAPGNDALYITDAEGNRVGDLASFKGDLFLSHEAPQIVYLKRDLVAARASADLAKDKPSTQASSSVLMTLHGGNVLVANKTKAIFWGSWSNPGDIISGIDSFFSGWGSSGMAGDSTEYYGTTDGHVTSSSTYLGHTIDSSTPPKRALSTSGAVSEACKITGNNPDPNAVYFIYTSTGAGHVNYCAWHSWGSCSNGAPIQVAYMPNITGIAGCDPQSDVTSESEGLAALANVTSHELSEATTDPRGDGWFDASNAENGDKCAWSFHNDVSLSNGSRWKLQMEWSNAAYSAGTGYANSSGQKGCLQ
ncbi:MAG TPA: hypothetical protein VFB32_06030 [Rudaea sp.]|nr:hypothetical protein [Rudaea sp.]